MATTYQNGHSDEYFINLVRRTVRDQPAAISENFAADGTLGTLLPGSKPFRLMKPPIIRGSVNIEALGNPVVVYDTDPAAGQVAVNTDTGEMIFLTAPAQGNIKCVYRTSKYSDAEILDALGEGLMALYPDIWQPATDTTLALSATSFEYPLPAQAVDTRTVILKAEVLFPTGFDNWEEVRDWDIVGMSSIKFNHLRMPGSMVRLTYNAPYQSLSDVEPECMHLPVYFAVGRLMANQETERTRSGDLPALTGAAASQPGTSARIADYWLQRFETEKARFARPLPIRGSVVSIR